MNVCINDFIDIILYVGCTRMCQELALEESDKANASVWIGYASSR